MYRPDPRDAMIEGYTEALDDCKDIAEKTLDTLFLKPQKRLMKRLQFKELFIQSRNKWRNCNGIRYVFEWKSF